jgi:hypothetical protein
MDLQCAFLCKIKGRYNIDLFVRSKCRRRRQNNQNATKSSNMILYNVVILEAELLYNEIKACNQII